MRIRIVLGVHGVVAGLVLALAGCNAIMDFGGTFGGGQRDAGGADSGPKGPRDDAGANDGGRDTGVPEQDASTPSDSGMRDANLPDADVADGGEGDGAVEPDPDAAMSCPSEIEMCENGIDDDCDELADCEDPDCLGQTSCCYQAAENTLLACSDAIDNDCDRLMNCDDPECAGLGACCEADGMTEAAAPNDGKDNDCDGRIDIPQLISASPVQGLPSSGAEVSLRFMTEIDRSAVLQCRTRRQTNLTPGAYANCPMDGSTVKPFTADSSLAAHDGAWATDVRWAFGSGAVSEVYTFKYYVHHSLHGVERCTSQHTDEQWFAKAAEYLSTPDAGQFRLGEDTFLAMPFIRVSYQTPVSTLDRFQLNGAQLAFNMWSLRRRFTLSEDRRYLLMIRNYEATRTGSCAAAGVNVHNRQRTNSQNGFHQYGCDAIVLNRAGAGVCLVNGTPTPLLAPNSQSNDSYANALGWTHANKFMFRILVKSSSTGLINFMPKCAAQPCPSGALFLPNRALYAPLP